MSTSREYFRSVVVVTTLSVGHHTSMSKVSAFVEEELEDDANLDLQAMLNLNSTKMAQTTC